MQCDGTAFMRRSWSPYCVYATIMTCPRDKLFGRALFWNFPAVKPRTWVRTTETWRSIILCTRSVLPTILEPSKLINEVLNAFASSPYHVLLSVRSHYDCFKQYKTVVAARHLNTFIGVFTTMPTRITVSSNYVPRCPDYVHATLEHRTWRCDRGLKPLVPFYSFFWITIVLFLFYKVFI